MKFNNQFLLYVLVVAMALLFVSITSRPVEDHDQVAFSIERSGHHLEKQEVEASLRYHFHKKQPKHKMTCKRFPMICQAKGSSAGSHCCKNKCVNVLSDKQNCGMCGKKCRYNEICCGGKCVNPSFDKRHCGGCNNRCNKEGFCTFGLCGYA